MSKKKTPSVVKKEESDAIYENRATLEQGGVIDHTPCDRCMEDFVFAMKDNYHSFSIGLTTILQCLFIAEQEGCVPELPRDWTITVISRFRRE